MQSSENTTAPRAGHAVSNFASIEETTATVIASSRKIAANVRHAHGRMIEP
jgi:hypothetical protein